MKKRGLAAIRTSLPTLGRCAPPPAAANARQVFWPRSTAGSGGGCRGRPSRCWRSGCRDSKRLRARRKIRIPCGPLVARLRHRRVENRDHWLRGYFFRLDRMLDQRRIRTAIRAGLNKIALAVIFASRSENKSKPSPKSGGLDRY